MTEVLRVVFEKPYGLTGECFSGSGGNVHIERRCQRRAVGIGSQRKTLGESEYKFVSVTIKYIVPLIMALGRDLRSGRKIMISVSNLISFKYIIYVVVLNIH